jgi:hypothetical protein
MTPSEVLVNLAACVEATLQDEGLAPVCFNGVVPGDGISAAWGAECDDGGPCGMAWTRLVLAYPATAVGQQDQTPGNCGAGIGLDIEVGILRCTPVGLQDAETEEVDALASSMEVLNDMLALRKAIQCCTSLPSKDVVLGSWTPMGPLGGLVGGAWGLFVAL